MVGIRSAEILEIIIIRFFSRIERCAPAWRRSVSFTAGSELFPQGVQSVPQEFAFLLRWEFSGDWRLPLPFIFPFAFPSGLSVSRMMLDSVGESGVLTDVSPSRAILSLP